MEHAVVHIDVCPNCGRKDCVWGDDYYCDGTERPPGAKRKSIAAMLFIVAAMVLALVTAFYVLSAKAEPPRFFDGTFEAGDKVKITKLYVCHTAEQIDELVDAARKNDNANDIFYGTGPLWENGACTQLTGRITGIEQIKKYMIIEPAAIESGPWFLWKIRLDEVIAESGAVDFQENSEYYMLATKPLVKKGWEI